MAIKISTTFLMRKLHQLTGIVPLGIFFFVHMFTNSTALSGAKVFNEHVEGIHNIPYLLFVEIFGIFLPLVFHSVYGIFISAEMRSNVSNYGYGRNWFYLFQRITGIFLFVFLLFHLLNLRFGVIPGLPSYGNSVASNVNESFAIVSREFQNGAILFFYILGVLATAWHLAYGFFLFAVDWGILIGEKAQKYALYASVGLSIFLGAVGVNAAAAFIRPCGILPSAFCEQAKEKGIVTPSTNEGSRKF